jgi:hypothetical protein
MGTGRNQLKPGQENMGDNPVLPYYSLLKKKSWTKTDRGAGALS